MGKYAHTLSHTLTRAHTHTRARARAREGVGQEGRGAFWGWKGAGGGGSGRSGVIIHSIVLSRWPLAWPLDIDRVPLVSAYVEGGKGIFSAGVFF